MPVVRATRESEDRNVDASAQLFHVTHVKGCITSENILNMVVIVPISVFKKNENNRKSC